LREPYLTRGVKLSDQDGQRGKRTPAVTALAAA